MSNKLLLPCKVLYGKNSLIESIAYINDLGKKALIITDDIMVKIGNISKLTDMLEKSSIEYEVFSDVNAEPTDTMVYEGTIAYKNACCDFLIALGGGSAIDAMKAIGVMVNSTTTISGYMGKVITQKLPPMAAIPTTAGTGSEATQFTIITDTKNDVKMLLKGPNLIPVLSIIDPEFTKTAPEKVTASTGIDALTHAIEAYTSRCAQQISDTFALSAIKKIFGNLLKAYKDGNDLGARSEMALASFEAGVAFNNSSVTIVHGMSRPIGALFHVPHGTSNAILLKECLEFAKESAILRFADIAKAIGIYKNGMSDEEAAEALVEAAGKLCSDLCIPTIRELGVNKDIFFSNIDKMAEDALISGSPDNTMRKPSKADIIQIYKKLWD